MTHAAAQIEAAPSPAPDEAAELVALGLDQLRELAGIGMTFARALGRIAQAAVEAAGGETPAPTPELSDAALAFSRVSRAVRMTVGLQTKILRDRQARADRFTAEKAARDAEAAEVLEDRRSQGNLRRAMTRFIVGTAIEAEERDEEEVEKLCDGLEARIREIGEDGLAFEEVDIKETAYAIARDLGIDPGPEWWMEAWDFEAGSAPLGARASCPRRGPEARATGRDGVTDVADPPAPAAAPP